MLLSVYFSRMKKLREQLLQGTISLQSSRPRSPQGSAGGLRDALPHYEEVRDAHGGEKEECAGGGERLQHPRG